MQAKMMPQLMKRLLKVKMERTTKKVKLTKKRPKMSKQMRIKRKVLTKKTRRRIRPLMKFSVLETSRFRVSRRGGLLLDIPLTLRGKKYPKMVMMKRPKMRTKRIELVSCDT